MRDVGVALDGAATRTFRRAVDWTVKLLLPLAVVALMMGLARVFLDMAAVWRSPTISAGFDVLVTDILSMFVVVELLRSVVDYFEVHRLEITFILDAALVFVLREVMFGLYRHEMRAAEILALAGMLLAVGGVRIAVARLSHGRSERAG